MITAIYMNDFDDELRPDYNLTSMKVRRVGKGRLKQHLQLDENDDLLPHYDLDFSKSKPNRFAEAYKKGVTRIILTKEEIDSERSVSDDEAE